MNRAHQPARSGAENGVYRVAIVGAGTLKGKELAEVLSEMNLSYGLEDAPGARVRSPWVERDLC
jgi:hypothetical protein